LGVVVVLCSESLATFRQLACDPENPATVLHVYSKCGKTEEEVREQLGKMAACVRTFRTVETTLATEVAWPKHHAEYLEHIISKSVAPAHSRKERNSYSNYFLSPSY
jgi:glucose-6-phosphate isomerase